MLLVLLLIYPDVCVPVLHAKPLCYLLLLLCIEVSSWLLSLSMPLILSTFFK
jgi:hypothetical protein